MPVQPTYPGVYVMEIPSGARTIAGVSTSIAVFIDYFRRGPMNRAVRIFSFGDFEREFGGLDALSEASYAIQQFFLNGGSQAYVIRVAGEAPLPASVSISNVSPAGGEVMMASAISEGTWGNRIRIKIDHNTNPIGLFNMLVSEYDGANTPVRQETFLGLSVDSTSSNYVEKAINDPNQGSKIIRLGNIDSSNLPAANGTVSGEHLDIFAVSITSAAPKLWVLINGIQVSNPVTLLPPSSSRFPGSFTLRAMALMLENAIRSAAPADPTLSKAKVSVAGNRLHVLAGGNTSSVILTFRNFNASDDTANELLLTDRAIPNVQEYVLGANENGSSVIGRPDWAGATSYSVGDIVVESGKVYICNSAHTSSAIFTDDRNNWEEVAKWESGMQYSLDVYVEESGTVYRCLIPHTSSASIADDQEAPKWDEVTTPPWAGATSYSVGDIVVESGKVYICNSAHTSSAIFTDDSNNWEEVAKWESGMQYSLDVYVEESGTVYRCLIPHTSSASIADDQEAPKWDEVTTPPWAGATSYSVGAIAVEAGKMYRCLIDHPSSATFSNDLNNLKWKLINDWESGKIYSIRDVVVQSSTLYRCLANHTSTSFNLDADKWAAISNLPIEWNSAQISGVSGNNGTPPDATAIIGSLNSKTGIHALEDVDLFNIMCIPRTAITSGTNAMDSTQADTVMAAAIEYCRQKRAFFIMDTPLGVDELPEITNWMEERDTLRADNAAIYYPRVLSPDPLDNFRLRSFGASGSIAGLYARTDSNRGVWKAPAGTEANLRNVSQLDDVLSDRENGALNPLGINCLHNLPVYGNICWGGRTLAGADANVSEWKYIPVRRLAFYLEESLFRGLHWVVFEPNDEPLWAQIRLNVGAFMNNLFKQGAFQGTSPRDAYFVKCDRETTTQNDINLGVVNVLVGFAPLKPAEFVFIKIQQLAGQIQS